MSNCKLESGIDSSRLYIIDSKNSTTKSRTKKLTDLEKPKRQHILGKRSVSLRALVKVEEPTIKIKSGKISIDDIIRDAGCPSVSTQL